MNSQSEQPIVDDGRSNPHSLHTVTNASRITSMAQPFGAL